MEPLKELPYNEEAERSLIALCLMEPSNLNTASEILSPNDFYNPKNRAIYEGMIKLFSEGKPIAISSLIEIIDKTPFKDVNPNEYIGEIISETVPLAPVETFAEIIRKNSIKRDLISLGMKLTQMAYSQKDVNTLLDFAEQMLLNISNQRFSRDFEHISDLMA